MKSGGDEFHGDVYFDYQDDSTIGDNVPPMSSGRPAERTTGRFQGPVTEAASSREPHHRADRFQRGRRRTVVPGHAWFYGGYRKNNQFKYAHRRARPGADAAHQLHLQGHLAINSKNQIIGFYNQRTKLQAARNLSYRLPFATLLVSSVGERPVEARVDQRSSTTGRSWTSSTGLAEPVPALSPADPLAEHRGTIEAGYLSTPPPAHGRTSYYQDQNPEQAPVLRQRLLLQGRLERHAQLQVRHRDRQGRRVLNGFSR